MSSGSCCWKAPSNIALVKYWGKHGRQLPLNPSISFTLNGCATTMSLKWSAGQGNVTLNFAGESAPKFEQKIHSFIHSVQDIFPFILNFDFFFESHNSFPHSAGIASSASSMAALSLCLCTMAHQVDSSFPAVESGDFYRLANNVARLASGSACRSVYGQAAVWGKCELAESSDEFAIPFVDLHQSFLGFHDSILVIDSNEKAVSSRVGHSLMIDHPFAAARFEQAKGNMHKIIECLRTGDIFSAGEIIEEEALSLHAMMQTSRPSFILMKSNSLIAIEKVRAFRLETKLPLFFTLDAGPNLHLLYPREIADQVQPFINEQLAPLCQIAPLHDCLGSGPERLV